MNHLILFIKEVSNDPLIQFLAAISLGGIAFLGFYHVVSKFEKFKEFITGLKELVVG